MRSSIPARFSLFSLQTHLRLRGIKRASKSSSRQNARFGRRRAFILGQHRRSVKRVRLEFGPGSDRVGDERQRGDDDLNDDPASMRWIEPVEMTPGTHKYVLMKVCDEEMERKSSSSGRTRGVRTTRRTFREAVGELRKDERMATLKAHVIGGGRIEYDKEKKRVFVYGYSMTFGRTPGCNKKTMEIIRKRFAEEDGDGPLAECEWSDEGY